MAVIEYEKRGRVAYVTINRPEAMNALNREVQTGLADAWREVESDDDVFAAVLSGAGGRAFSAGADLKTMETGDDRGEPTVPAQREDGALGPSVKGVSKPVVAAIDGYCLAGGLELALACDIRIATERSQFGCPEVKWNLLHGFGAQVMPFSAHMSSMMELLLTGEFIDAEEALRIGLVSQVVEPLDLISTANDMAAKIAVNSPLAIRLTKELARRGRDMSLADGLRLYQEYSRLAFSSDDAREGTRAFAERRDPEYQGLTRRMTGGSEERCSSQ